MIKFSKEKITEAYEKTDPIIKQVVDDSWVTEDMVLIGKKLSLRVDKTDAIIRIIGYVILNLIPISKLIDSIILETGIEKEKATEIAKKIDEIIFTKIRQALKDGEKKNDLSEARVNNLKSDGNELIDNIESYADKFSEEENEKTFSDMLDETRPSKVSKKVVDPYREVID